MEFNQDIEIVKNPNSRYKKYYVHAGSKNGNLTVIEKILWTTNKWRCECKCGSIIELTAYQFSIRKSCGLCRNEWFKKELRNSHITHGLSNTRLYKIYNGVKSRCYNTNNKRYSLYGGRGIKICDEWLHSFESFYKWAYEAGYDDNKNFKEQSIDRIDINGDYCPENCRWVDAKEQALNRSTTTFISFHNKNIPVTEFAEMCGLKNGTVQYHRMKGRTGEEIIKIWEKNHSQITINKKIYEKYFGEYKPIRKQYIDISLFDKFIIHVPEDVGDEYSYIRGVEDMLDLIRSAKTENEEEGLDE